MELTAEQEATNGQHVMMHNYQPPAAMVTTSLSSSGGMPRKILSFLTQAPVVNKWEEGETRFRVRSNMNPQHSDVHLFVSEPRHKKKPMKRDEIMKHGGDEQNDGNGNNVNISARKIQTSSSSSSSTSSSSFSSFASLSSSVAPIVDAMTNGSYFENEEYEDDSKRSPVGPFRQYDLVQGSVVIAAKDGWTHNGVYLTVLGEVTFPQRPLHPLMDKVLEPEKALQQEKHHVYQRQKHLQSILPPRIRFIELCIPLLPKGKLAFGIHQIPFSFPLEPCNNMFQNGNNRSNFDLYETLHGDQIRIDYNLHVCIDRGVFPRPIDSRAEIKVETPVIVANESSMRCNPVTFTISSTQLDHSDNMLASVGGNGTTQLPPPTANDGGISVLGFALECCLRSKLLDLSDPFVRGSLTLKHCEGTAISSVSIFLKRVECFFYGADPNIVLDEHNSTVAMVMATASSLEEEPMKFEMEVPEVFVSPSLCHIPHPNNRVSVACVNSNKPVIGFEIKYHTEVVVKLECGRKARTCVPVQCVRSATTPASSDR
jgi:hypothetical protein